MCSVEECEDKQAVSASLKGTDITSATIRCEKFLHLYKPGDRVMALMAERFRCALNTKGTVSAIKTGRDKGKLVVCLDDNAFENVEEGNLIGSHNRFIRLWPKHVRELAEPRVKVCRECGTPEGVEPSSDWFCPVCKGDDTRIPI
jgi:hypothetical protein